MIQRSKKMKKLYFLLAICSILSLLVLAGCGAADDVEGTPGIIEPATVLTLTPEDIFTEEPTEFAQATESPEVTAEVTETPAMTEPIVATQTITATEVIPPTGFVDPGRVSNLLDFDVWNPNDEQIGTAEDMILNLEEQKIDYLLIEVGGFLGIGGKLVAVPYDLMEVVGADATSEDELQNVFILDASREELESAPEFDRQALPQVGQPAGDYDAIFSSHWMTGTESMTGTVEIPQATDTSDPVTGTELQGVVLASQVLDLNVVDANGDDLASVEDIIADPQSGDIRYLVVEVSGIEDLEGDWIFVPLEALSVDVTNDVPVASVDRDVLAGAPSFLADELPDTTVVDWDADIRAYWDAHR